MDNVDQLALEVEEASKYVDVCYEDCASDPTTANFERRDRARKAYKEAVEALEDATL